MRCGQIAAALCVGLFAAAPVPIGAQREPAGSLQELTVPDGKLAPGCRLSPPPSEGGEARQARAAMFAGLPITSNPWRGGDRQIVVSIRQRIDGVAEMPDGPPLDGRQLTDFRMHLADDVEDAYAAVYAIDDAQPVTVLAVRLRSEADAAPAPSRRAGVRFASGRTIARVAGERSPCFAAVAAHVARLLPPGLLRQ